MNEFFLIFPWGSRPRLYAYAWLRWLAHKQTLEPAERVTASTLDVSFVVFNSINADKDAKQ